MSWLEYIFGKWVIKRRFWIIAITIIVVFAASWGMQFLTFSQDNRVFFSKVNPQLKALEALENTYTKEENVVFVVAPKDKNVFTPKTLSAIEELTNKSWKTPYSNRVDSITNFQHTRVEADDLIVDDLARDAKKLTHAELKQIKKTALSEPLLVNRLISPSGDVTSVYINVILPGKSLKEVPEVTAFARKLADNFRKEHPDIKLYLTGGVIIDNAFAKVSQDDLTTLMPIMFVTLVIIVGLALHSIIGTIATLTIILISTLTAMGLAGWLRTSLNTASVAAPTIVLTLAVADSVHILSSVFQQIRMGKSKYEAIAESMRINFQAVFLTSITTAIGFLTMNFSDAPPFRDLGNIVAVGVMAAFFYSVLFLPSLIAVLPIGIKINPANAGCPGCDRLASFIIKRRKIILRAILAVTLFLISGLFGIELNDNFIKYFGKHYQIRRASDFMEENLTGLDIIDYSLESGEASGINNPEYLNKIEEFANWYRAQPKVVHVNVITDIIKRLNKNMHQDNPEYYRIPENRELAAQYLLLYEMSLPFGLNLNNQINVDKSSTRMTVTLKKTSAKEQRQLDTKARQWLKANAPKSMFTYGSGLSIIWAHISKRNINSMLGASLCALILISLILIFALRSIKLGIISLIPNLTPAFMAFGIWGMAIHQVGLALSVIIAMTLGIVVDDTIHFLSKYLRARREHNLNPGESIRYAFNTVGTAMWVTTAALVAGFLVLATSNFKMTSDMGLMTAITISLALLMDFFLLPTLLMKAEA